MEFKDYYQILGVDSKADLKEIKLAYRRLARKYHPDVSKQADAEEKFREVAEAYEVLKDPEKRAEYDELREYGERAKFDPGQQGYSGRASGFQSAEGFDGDYSDFFRTVFGQGASGFGFEGRQSEAFSTRGQDVEMEMPIFLEDSLAPTKKSVSYNLQYLDAQGRPQIKPKTLEVTIPAGVIEGERIRLKGQGGPGREGGVAGDLYLLIRLVPHPLFDVEAHNLVLTLPIAPWEAALGVKVEIPTLDGKVSLKIPANTKAGQRLRIKGKGLMRKDKSRGDLFAQLKVVMPAANTEDQKALWTELAAKSEFDPRAEWR